MSNSKDTKENNGISKSAIQSFWGYKLSRVCKQCFWSLIMLILAAHTVLILIPELSWLGVLCPWMCSCVACGSCAAFFSPSPGVCLCRSANHHDTAHSEFLTPGTTILKTDLILLKKLRSTECPKAYPSWNRHNWKVLAHHLSVNDGPLRRIY